MNLYLSLASSGILGDTKSSGFGLEGTVEYSVSEQALERA